MPAARTARVVLTGVFVSTALAVAVPATDGVWPVDRPRVLESFAPPARDWLAGHRGVDLAARPGERVRAVVDGEVAFAGSVAGKPVVTVALPDGRRVTYEPVLARVSVGQQVATGQLLGVVASSGGHCGGAGCIHIGLRTPDGYADPLMLIGRRPAVLKPL